MVQVHAEESSSISPSISVSEMAKQSAKSHRATRHVGGHTFVKKAVEPGSVGNTTAGEVFGKKELEKI